MQPASNQWARGLALLTVVCLHVMAWHGLVGAALSQPPEEDPYLLLEQIDTRLQDGQIEAAGKKLDQLNMLLADSPGWDPDGTFRQRVLPDLDHRINGLRDAEEQLDTLYREGWESKKIPESLLVSRDVRMYLNWSTETIYTLRERREAAIDHLDATDRALLYETEGYRRIQMVLETGIVQRAREFTREVVKRIDKEDARIRALRTRLDSLKRDTIDLVAQREQLIHELDLSREKIEQYLDALSAMVTEGIGDSADRAIPEVQQVDEVFFTLLNRRIDSMRTASSQSSAEKAARLEAVDRYRHYNRVLVRAQVVSDQAASIGILEKLITDLPIVEPQATASSQPGEAQASPNMTVLLMAGGFLLAVVASLIWLKRSHAPDRGGREDRDGPVDLYASDDLPIAAEETESSSRSSTGPR